MSLNFYKNLIAVAVILSISSLSSFGQKVFFQPATGNTRLDPSVSKHIEKYSLYRLKVDDLRSYLLNAPLEFKSKTAIGVELEVPLPNGTVEVFSMFESPILAPEIAAQHPEIKTYAGKGTSHKEYSIRINLTANGFNAIILGVDSDAVHFEKTSSNTKDNLYRSFFHKDAQSPQNSKNKTSDNRCGTLDIESIHNKANKTPDNNRVSTTLSTGTELRTFRLAMAANAEFTEKRGGTSASAFAAITNYVNNMIAVYRKELSVSFVLVSGENVVYTNASSDPYNNDSQSDMMDQNQVNLDAMITSGYDIGHVLGYTGGSGGGVAFRGTVCDPDLKGKGTSGIGDGSYADVFDQQLIQHEIGHQFDMSHSYNSNVPVCTTRAHETSVEPGSGTTIMSYGYTCNNDDAASGLVGNDDYETPYAPILHFHAVNYDQANAFISGLSCYTSTPTNNSIPVITSMQTSWTIPKSTPFSLTASATDTDAADVLSYSWEGTNVSDVTDNNLLTANIISNDSKPPFFRSYAPVPSTEANAGTRYFPRLSAILSGDNYAIGDKLPSIGIATTHRLSVRDNDSGLAYENVTVTVDGGSGPFLETTNLSGSYLAGSSQTITWSVNNTNIAPISCTFVDIWLSVDGGLTFPTLLTSTANDGSESVTFPASMFTTMARIKVAASSNTSLRVAANGRVQATVPNIFFDISNSNFTIADPMPVRLVAFNVSLIEKNNASLTWTTTEETNNSGFDIEMSTDARTFVKVGYTEGKGNSKALNNYSYTVSDLSGGNYYFRLKQLDYDGKFEYSRVESLTIKNADDIASIYPNPTKDKVKILSNLHKNQAFSIEVANQNGQIVLTLPASANYLNGYELDATSFKTGLYFIVLKGENFTETLKFVKL
jgi:Fe-S cluster assembly iron-binding protein IscA